VSNTGPGEPAPRSTGSRSRRVATRAPTPAAGSSQPSCAPSFQRIANRILASRDGLSSVSPVANWWTSRPKSWGPPGVGSAHTS
jgi:hypothetical protein